MSEPVVIGKAATYKICFIDPKTGNMTLPATNLEVKSYLAMEMNGATHRSTPVTITFNPAMPNYIVSNAVFLMEGVWQIHVELVDANGTVVDQGYTEQDFQ